MKLLKLGTIIDNSLKLFVASVLPIFIFVCTWWLPVSTNFYLHTNFDELYIMLFSSSSFLITWFLEIVFWNKMFNNIYKYNYFLLVAVYIFYTVGMFGFFMGVPIFNPFLGVVAGIYICRRIQVNKIENKTVNKMTLITVLFSTFVIILVCISSAYFALHDPYTESNLQGMFGVHSFEITRNMVKGIIFLGGIFLIVFQTFITFLTIRITRKYVSV